MSIDVTISFTEEQVESLRQWQALCRDVEFDHPDGLWNNALRTVVLPAPRYIPKPGDLVHLVGDDSPRTEVVVGIVRGRVQTAWIDIDRINYWLYQADAEFERVPE